MAVTPIPGVSDVRTQGAQAGEDSSMKQCHYLLSLVGAC